MDLQLNGKLALVSGSTAGIGLAIATALAQEGARVIVNGRLQSSVDEVVAALRSSTGADVAGIRRGSQFGRRRPRTLARRHPDVEILVNNLGIFEPKPFEDIPDADWMRFFDVNVLSGVRLARLFLPSMKRANWGRIIFISSESAVQIPAEMIHYGMTKTAQLAVSRGLAEVGCRHRHHRQQHPAWPDEIARGRRLCRKTRADRGKIVRGVRKGVFREGSPDLAHQAIRHDAGGRFPGRLYRQPACLRHDRRRPAGRWRRYQERVLECDRLRLLQPQT